MIPPDPTHLDQCLKVPRVPESNANRIDDHEVTTMVEVEPGGEDDPIGIGEGVRMRGGMKG